MTRVNVFIGEANLELCVHDLGSQGFTVQLSDGSAEFVFFFDREYSREVKSLFGELTDQLNDISTKVTTQREEATIGQS